MKNTKKAFDVTTFIIFLDEYIEKLNNPNLSFDDYLKFLLYLKYSIKNESKMQNNDPKIDYNLFIEFIDSILEDLILDCETSEEKKRYNANEKLKQYKEKLEESRKETREKSNEKELTEKSPPIKKQTQQTPKKLEEKKSGKILPQFENGTPVQQEFDVTEWIKELDYLIEVLSNPNFSVSDCNYIIWYRILCNKDYSPKTNYSKGPITWEYNPFNKAIHELKNQLEDAQKNASFDDNKRRMFIKSLNECKKRLLNEKLVKHTSSNEQNKTYTPTYIVLFLMECISITKIKEDFLSFVAFAHIFCYKIDMYIKEVEKIGEKRTVPGIAFLEECKHMVIDALRKGTDNRATIRCTIENFIYHNFLPEHIKKQLKEDNGSIPRRVRENRVW